MTSFKTAGVLICCIAGIYGSYLTQGVVQESMAIKRYGREQARFTQLKALNGAQSAVCFVWALLLVFLTHKRADTGKLPPVWRYWKAAITNSVGPACGFEALKNISYPAQVLAKSCKMIPVMIMGTIVGGVRYSSLEYVCALMLAGGISLFAHQSMPTVEQKLANPNAPLGYFLCLVNLLFDGYTNATQDQIHKQHPKTTALWTMCCMNMWCTLYYAGYLFGVDSSGMDLVAFCRRHPGAGMDVLLFCLCGAVGQVFIFFTIRTFGSLANTIICTTRKFFNILLSVLWNGNPLLLEQWIAVALVFSGLAVNMASKARRPRTASGKSH